MEFDVKHSKSSRSVDMGVRGRELRIPSAVMFDINVSIDCVMVVDE